MKILQALFLSLLPALVFAASPISLVKDLQQDAATSTEQHTPIVVIYTASYCHYCEAVKSEFFTHMARDENAKARYLLREVIIDSSNGMKDFDGKSSSHGSFADKKNIYLVPTVGFYDPAGNDLAEPLIGVVTLDYYGWYLDKRIQTAERKLKEQTIAAASN